MADSLLGNLTQVGTVSTSHKTLIDDGTLPAKYATVAQFMAGGMGAAAFTATGTGGSARTLQSKLEDAVYVEDFGAVGDGTTDDSTAFTNAMAASDYVLGKRGKIYVVKDLTIGGTTTLDMQGGILRAASGARWVVRLEGWRPQFLNAEVEDSNAYLVKQTTVASSAIATATSLVTTSATGMATMMALAVEQDDGEWHQTLITAVNVNTLTLQRGLRGAATAGNRVWATHAAVWIGDAGYYSVVDNILFKNCWGAIASKPTALGTLGTTKAYVGRILGYGARMFGFHLAGNTADIAWMGALFYGSYNVTNSYAGNGATTAYATTDTIVRVGATTDLTVTVNGAAKTEGVDYTVTGSRQITFTSAPANGATISIVNSVDGISGMWSDISGGNLVNGGHVFVTTRFLDFRYGRRLVDSVLLDFHGGFVDTISGDGIRLEGNAASINFTGEQSLFCAKSCIRAADTTVGASTISFTGLNTTLWPSSELQSGTLGSAVIMAASSALTFDAASWRGTKTSSLGASAVLALPGVQLFFFNSAGTLAAGLTRYLGPSIASATENDAEFRVPAVGQILALRVDSTDAPGSGQTYTATVRVAAADTSAVATISGGASFSATWNGAVAVTTGQSITLKIATSGSAATTRFSGWIAVAAN